MKPAIRMTKGFLGTVEVRLIHFEVNLLSCNLKMKVRAIFPTRRQEA